MGPCAAAAAVAAVVASAGAEVVGDVVGGVVDQFAPANSVTSRRDTSSTVLPTDTRAG